MERKEMDFGKKYRAGNFEYFKTTKSLSKREVKALRDASGIPADVQKHLQRASLPYITVQTVGGGWCISFVCGSAMYEYIEFQAVKEQDGENALTNLFTMMYSDTAIMGDTDYWKAKAAALHDFMERIQAKNVSNEDDDKILDAMKTEEEAKEAIAGLAEDILKEDGHE